jgi:hypothetical protein
MTLAQRPVRTCEKSTIIESDSSVGADSQSSVAQIAIYDTAVLHVGGQEAKRNLPDLRPCHRLAVAERAVGGGDQTISFAIKRYDAHTPDRLVIEVGEARISL